MDITCENSSLLGELIPGEFGGGLSKKSVLSRIKEIFDGAPKKRVLLPSDVIFLDKKIKLTSYELQAHVMTREEEAVLFDALLSSVSVVKDSIRS